MMTSGMTMLLRFWTINFELLLFLILLFLPSKKFIK
jgi:hypothetical protein